jgi:drug/metabolite transporter (DMT)-like permease
MMPLITMSTAPSRTLPGAAAAAVTILFWGSAFAGIRAGLHSYTPAHLALLRFLAASAGLGVVAAFRGIRLPALRDVPLIALLGLLGFSFYNVALNTGEMTIEAGPAALLIQTLPIWTALAAVLFLRERLRPMGWLGIGVSFCGALLIALGKGSGFAIGWGAGLILLASISASAYNILQKSMLGRYGPLELTTHAIWAGTVLLLPFSSGLIAEVRAAPLTDTLAVVYLGVGPAALAYVTWAVVLSRLPASRASSMLFVVPVVAFLVGWAWLGEAPTLIDAAGGVLAMGGVALVNTLGKAPTEKAPTEKAPAEKAPAEKAPAVTASRRSPGK